MLLTLAYLQATQTVLWTICSKISKGKEFNTKTPWWFFDRSKETDPHLSYCHDIKGQKAFKPWI